LLLMSTLPRYNIHLWLFSFSMFLYFLWFSMTAIGITFTESFGYRTGFSILTPAVIVIHKEDSIINWLGQDGNNMEYNLGAKRYREMHTNVFTKKHKRIFALIIN
ncbi:hypothetical protein ACJX0J_033664, partial [Zea mays]